MNNMHFAHLELLVYHLDKIGEDKKDIAWIMCNGIWIKDNNMLKMPDIIAYMYSNNYLVAELKGNKSKKYKAIEQIESGVKFIQTFYDLNAKITKKFVVYLNKGYYYEEIR